MLKTFKIGSLFYKPDLQFSSDHVFDKQLDLSKTESDEFSIPVVNAKHGNNGVMYFGRPSDFQHVSNSIDIVADGAKSVGDVYYQRSDTGVLYNSYLIRLKDSKIADNHFVVVYLTTVLRKRIKGFFGYENKATWDRIKELDIGVPVTDSGQLDVQYMEKYIKRVEADYIKRVEAYLKTLGYESLDDCELSSQDLKVLSGPDKWGEFRIDDLFDEIQIRRKYVRNELSSHGQTPVYSSVEENGGILGYINNQAEFELDVNHPYIVFGDHTRTIQIPDNDFSVADNVKVLRGKHAYSVKQLLYIMTCFKKVIPNLGYSRHWTTAKKLHFCLPVYDDGSIAYDFMDQYITAIEKKKVSKLKQAMEHKLELYREVSHQN